MERARVTLVFALAGCSATSAVARVEGRSVIEGRYVPEEAYAAFVEGAWLEAKGQEQEAEGRYRDTLHADPASVEAEIALARVLCARAPAESRGHFARAERLRPDSPQLWRERAACGIRTGSPKDAVALAYRAVLLQPEEDANRRAMVSALLASKRLDAARAWSAWEALPDWEAVPAEEALPVATRPVVGGALGEALQAQEAQRNREARRLGDALRLHDAPTSKRLARALHLPLASLSLHALREGFLELAAETSALVLEADPTSADAWVSDLIAHDLSRDAPAYAQRLASPSPTGPLSALGEALLAQLIERRTGESLCPTRAPTSRASDLQLAPTSRANERGAAQCTPLSVATGFGSGL